MSRDYRSAYAEKLKDPRWQQVRLRIMERDRWACQRCYEDGKTLHVHHKYYIWGKEPWDYPDGCLVTLCVDCHELEEEARHDAPLMFQQFLAEKGFLNSHMVEIAAAFQHVAMPYLPEVMATFLGMLISGVNENNPQLQQFLRVCQEMPPQPAGLPKLCEAIVKDVRKKQ